jgi:hypothetical protein
VYTLQIMILVTGAALHWRRTHAVSSTPNIHDVPVQVVSLPRIVASSVADDATRMPQYWHNGLEGRNSFGAVRIGIRWRSLGDCVRRSQGSRQ